MTEAERIEHDALQDIADPFDFDDTHGDSTYEDAVLRGAAAADISHVGEGITEEDIERNERSILEQLREHHSKLFAHRRDTRMRTNRTQILVDAFALQMESMADAYVQWSLVTAEEGLGGIYQQPADSMQEGSLNLLVVDMYCALSVPYLYRI
ncbi:hypothetical protein C8R44DRAFT_753766 [Mycena epipterygia]|nr:hypothetical protein C8R44DRAFT_753766 [Mycena epipterygia]